MSAEHHLIERNQELKRELEIAIELIKRYEAMISEIQTQNSTTLRKTLHDLSSPLQIISMSIESLQMKAPPELQPSLERMKRSTDVMTSIIVSLRKIRSTVSDAKATQII